MQSKMARTEGGQRERERKEAIKTMVEVAVQVFIFKGFQQLFICYYIAGI